MQDENDSGNSFQREKALNQEEITGDSSVTKENILLLSDQKIKEKDKKIDVMIGGKYIPYILAVFILIWAYSIGAPSNTNVDELLVATPNGKVLGTLFKSRGNRTFYGYRGIPYAKPPIGNLRFRAPEPADPWEGVHDATKDVKNCLQKNYLFYLNPPIEGSEDCLYINVYTPTSSSYKKESHPVIVVIPYGGFISGSASSTYYGPEYLLDKNVVLVTFNYRVGIFGFYTTLDDAAPGNWAFKDQVLALRWVQENIKSFGGDPNKVTIIGTSAGAGSVHHHILSPSSAGLFHGAIQQSGSALALWAKPFNALQEQFYRAVAQIANCDQTDTDDLIDCMRGVDPERLVTIGDSFKYFNIEPLTIYTVVTETKTERNPEPFLTEDPLKIIESGKFSKVPWIIGANGDEGMLRSSPLTRQSETLKALNENIDILMPQMLLLSASSPGNEASLWANISSFYLASKPIEVNNPKSIQGLTNIYSDRSFNYASYQSALLHAYNGHSPIWFYNFQYKSKISYGDLFAATNETFPFEWGVSHCDELLYLFPSTEILPNLPEEDLQMSRIMVKIWTTFAKYGNPTPSEKCKRNCKISWLPLPNLEGVKPLKNEYLQYLNITGPYENTADRIKLEMQNEFYPERMYFWEKQDLLENVPIIN